jgi:uncharacterized membrane protein YkvA (DUF1232 family)
LRYEPVILAFCREERTSRADFPKEYGTPQRSLPCPDRVLFLLDQPAGSGFVEDSIPDKPGIIHLPSRMAALCRLGYTLAHGFLDNAKRWAKALKRDVVALWIAARDSRTPLHAKIAAGAVAAYALSPIDLIPDFIPVLGYLDDLLIVPVGIWLVVKMIPAPLMAEYRDRASSVSKPKSVAGLAVIVVIWIVVAALAGWWFWRHIGR